MACCKLRRSRSLLPIGNKDGLGVKVRGSHHTTALQYTHRMLTNLTAGVDDEARERFPELVVIPPNGGAPSLHTGFEQALAAAKGQQVKLAGELRSEHERVMAATTRRLSTSMTVAHERAMADAAQRAALTRPCRRRARRPARPAVRLQCKRRKYTRRPNYVKKNQT